MRSQSVGEHVSARADAGCTEESLGRFVGRQQRFHLPPQSIVSVDVAIEVGRTLFRRAGKGPLEQRPKRSQSAGAVMSKTQDFSVQPRFRQGPVPLHRNRRHADHGGGLFDGEPAEEPQFHELALAWIQLRQPLKRRIQRQDVDVERVGLRIAVPKRHPHVSPALEGVMRPRVVDEDPPHDVCRNREELRPILPSDLTLVNDPEVGLVDQRRRGHRVVRAFPLKIATRQPTQLAVNRLDQI